MTSGLMSWGRYPYRKQQGHTLEWQDQLAASIPAEGFLPYGNGRSYGDVCLASTDQVLVMRGLDHFLALDQQQGLIRAEAGVSLGEILALTVPRGWFLPVVPGTQFATLGGAIANDVHGKNHHVRGTFGCHVERLGLYRHGQMLECSPTANAELFAATIGGLGLTGVIVWAEVRLLPVQSARVDTLTQRFDSLDNFFELADQYDGSHEYGVAWIDCLSRGGSRGRGAYFAGNHARYGSSDVRPGRRLSVPLTPPLSMINPLTLKAFNEVYWRTKPRQLRLSRDSYLSYFFPLDQILHWNRIYGIRGFQQYQCVIPTAHERDAIAELLDCIARSRNGSFLAVLKRCGASVSPGLLSFPQQGTSLALDFPQSARTLRLFEELDRIVFAAGGRLYPAKDAHMQPEDFRRSYPAWEQLQAVKDPAIHSLFWERVTR